MGPKPRHRIEERAYALWEADGRPEGRALDYWLQAEQEIVNQSVAGEEDPLQAYTRRRPDDDRVRRSPSGQPVRNSLPISSASAIWLTVV